MESKSHCFGVYFIQLNSFSHFVSLSSHIPPQMHCGYVAHHQKHNVSEAAPRKKPYDVPLVPTLPFDYSTIILYPCKLERKGRLNNPIMYNSVAVKHNVFLRIWKPACLFLFRSFFPNGIISSNPHYPSCYQNNPQWNSNLRWTRLLGQLYSSPSLEQ